jgi:hypothetical protein
MDGKSLKTKHNKKRFVMAHKMALIPNKQKRIVFEEATNEQVATALADHDAVTVCNSRLFPKEIAEMLFSKFGGYTVRESYFPGSDSYPSKTDYTFYFGNKVLTARAQLDLSNYWDLRWLAPNHKFSEELHGVECMIVGTLESLE